MMQRHFSRNVATLLIGVALVGGLSACEQRDDAESFTPTQSPVAWESIASQGYGPTNVGYQTTVAGRTQGLFPASIAVARVRSGPASMLASGGARLALDMRPEVDFLEWNSVFDDLRAIAEVFPLHRLAMNGEHVSVPSILEAADATNAGICLIYTEVLPDRFDAEVRGVLYDVRQRTQLAVIRTDGHVTPPVDDDDIDPADPTARQLAVADFEQQARRCTLALIDNDDPAAPVRPEGWIPERPLEPILWPPIDERWLRDSYRR